MSVGFCSHLYQPETDFNANAFESWFHRGDRYRPDSEPDSEEEIAQDYVPSYSWLDSAVAQIRERARAIPKVEIVAPFRLVPISVRELEYDEEADVWDSEYSNPRLCLIEAVRCLEMAKRNHKNMPYKEWLPYVRAVQDAARQLEREAQPTLGKRLLRLVGRDE